MNSNEIGAARSVASVKRSILEIFRDTQPRAFAPGAATGSYQLPRNADADSVMEPLEARQLLAVDAALTKIRQTLPSAAFVLTSQQWSSATISPSEATVDADVIAYVRENQRQIEAETLDVEEDVYLNLPERSIEWIQVEVHDLGRARPSAIIDIVDQEDAARE